MHDLQTDADCGPACARWTSARFIPTASGFSPLHIGSGLGQTVLGNTRALYIPVCPCIFRPSTRYRPAVSRDPSGLDRRVPETSLPDWSMRADYPAPQGGLRRCFVEFGAGCRLQKSGCSTDPATFAGSARNNASPNLPPNSRQSHRGDRSDRVAY
jgi:hypothetical protein